LPDLQDLKTRKLENQAIGQLYKFSRFGRFENIEDVVLKESIC